VARILIVAYTNYHQDSRVKRNAEALAERGDQVEVLCRAVGPRGLGRDRMLARAALGMPVIVPGHPRDAGPAAVGEMRPHNRAAADFDEVLDFFAAKKLRPQSLEEIARDALAAGANPA
jgi:hypothetical protein